MIGTITNNQFSAVEYIKKLREANFTEVQAETVVEIIEQQTKVIQGCKSAGIKGFKFNLAFYW